MDAAVTEVGGEAVASSTVPTGDNRASVYVEANGTVVYRASALGSCVRSLAAHRMKAAEPRPHSPEMLARFAQGNDAEPRIIEYLGTQGWLLSDHGSQQREYDLDVFPGVVVRCHPDGIAHRMGEPAWTSSRVIEVKALGASLADKGLYALTHYPWQLTVEMLVTERKALYVVYNKSFDEIDEQSVVCKEIDETPYTLGQIKARIAKVEAAAARDQLPDCSQRDFPCQWYGILCQADTAADRPEAERDDAIAELCARVVAARDASKAAKAHEDEARELLLTALGDRERVAAGPYVATRVAVETSRFDRKRLEAERPEVAAEYVTVGTSTRLEVREA